MGVQRAVARRRGGRALRRGHGVECTGERQEPRLTPESRSARRNEGFENVPPTPLRPRKIPYGTISCVCRAAAFMGKRHSRLTARWPALLARSGAEGAPAERRHAGESPRRVIMRGRCRRRPHDDLAVVTYDGRNGPFLSAGKGVFLSRTWNWRGASSKLSTVASCRSMTTTPRSSGLRISPTKARTRSTVPPVWNGRSRSGGTRGVAHHATRGGRRPG